MRFFVLVLALAAVVGYLTGGSLRRVPEAGIRWPWLVVLALGMQLAPGPRPLAMALLYGSFAVLGAFVARNLRKVGFPLMLLGLLLNLVVIGANAGMPVSTEALVRSGQQDLLAELRAGDAGVKHHLAGPDTVLRPLADVIAFPPPIRQIISVGDLAVYGGGIWLLLSVMHDPRRRRAALPARLAADEPSGRSP